MSDIKLFTIKGQVKELAGEFVALERELQTLIENNMETFFGVTFLKTEYVTSNGGRIDSIGIDENNCPVIFEYKRSSNENVINQGLFYLDWLLDHKADFEILVMKILGKKYFEKIDWSMPRLICVAGNFTKYDEYAVKQINRNIDLVRYKKFDDTLLMFDLINSNVIKSIENKETVTCKNSNERSFSKNLENAPLEIKNLYYSARDYILALGDDIIENELKMYTAFKKIKNIICAEASQKAVVLYMRLNPENIQLEKGFTRDMRTIGHYGTGDLEVTIKNKNDLEKAKALIDKVYEVN